MMLRFQKQNQETIRQHERSIPFEHESQANLPSSKFSFSTEALPIWNKFEFVQELLSVPT